jgi:predicted ribosome quality control (RQC) complex YloA/Tae2 family protein
MQPFDFTTLQAVCIDLQRWLPARLEQVVQRDRYTLCFLLRTLAEKRWLTICWHPEAARLHLDEPPPREPDTFTFSQQLQHQLKGLALVAIGPICPWERAVEIQFAARPGDPIQWRLQVEIMGKHSNVLLVNPDNLLICVANQISDRESRVRPIQTGQPYSPPPRLQGAIPQAEESQADWQERLTLIPGPIAKTLRQVYRGLGSNLANGLAIAAQLEPSHPTDQLTADQWQALFDRWQDWLRQLNQGEFAPGPTATGYSITGWDRLEATELQPMLSRYYRDQLNSQNFRQRHHQVSQALQLHLGKLKTKAQDFCDRLLASADADRYRSQADLLMAHPQDWRTGAKSITLTDFDSGEPITIDLNPERSAVQNAQQFYKRHQKLKRSRAAIEPLLAAVRAEQQYLEQIEASLQELDQYRDPTDLITLDEIRDELIAQGYLRAPNYRQSKLNDSQTDFHRYRSPSGYPFWVGRNNRQNDQLVRSASDYDLWFHSQEIPGSHGLLRLSAGDRPEQTDLQWAANLSAYHSRARQSEQVPVVYTEPRHLYKPRGSKPGMVIYKQERIIWGQPHIGSQIAQTQVTQVPHNPQ